MTSSQSWANIILFYSEDERNAFDKFFDRFAEFVRRDSDENIVNETNGIKAEYRNRFSLQNF